MSYKEKSELFKEFGVEKIEIIQKWSNKYQKYYDYIQFPISELGVKGIKDVSYIKLKFDLKQLICHLIALANNDKETQKTLQYLFFTPSKAAIEKNKVLKNLYDVLKQEITAIWNADKIKSFCKHHNINLVEPKYIEINSIEDKVYPNVKW